MTTKRIWCYWSGEEPSTHTAPDAPGNAVWGEAGGPGSTSQKKAEGGLRAPPPVCASVSPGEAWLCLGVRGIPEPRERGYLWLDHPNKARTVDTAAEAECTCSPINAAGDQKMLCGPRLSVFSPPASPFHFHGDAVVGLLSCVRSCVSPRLQQRYGKGATGYWTVLEVLKLSRAQV